MRSIEGSFVKRKGRAKEPGEDAERLSNGGALLDWREVMALDGARM